LAIWLYWLRVNSEAHERYPLTLAPLKVGLPLVGERLWAFGYRHDCLDNGIAAVTPLVTSGIVTAAFPHGRGERMPASCIEVSDLAYGRVVAVESNKLDRYGRVIGKVLVNSQDVNLEQVRRGCGWHYKKYQNEQILDDRLSYNAAEESARASRVGLWADNEPMPPWEWRKTRRK